MRLPQISPLPRGSSRTLAALTLGIFRLENWKITLVRKATFQNPSTEEVTRNGLNLGEMDAILLKKIEELTLYILEQEDRIKHLEGKAK